MPITNVSRSVNLNTSGIFLPHPAGRGMDDGYYLIYSASSAANTLNLGAGWVRGYKWASILPTNRTDGYARIEGTIQLVSESLSGSSNWVRYHGSNIIHIGRGVNDITVTQEDDAIFFAHLGQYGATSQTNDEFFYWDRLFVPQGSTTWSYYQYHAHNPTSYVPFNNGRLTLAADNRHGPVGIEEYGHMINIAAKVGQTNYTSVMVRVHTPAVGGAHNSHNDTEMPANINRNYMMGGLMNGTSDRFHAFYISPTGSDWQVFSRTFNYVNGTFNAEVNHGTYDLADAQLAYSPGSSSLYPFRASAGKLYRTNVYIPVIYNSGSSGRFNLNTWEFASATNLAQNPKVYTILTGSAYRPDCHMEIANTVLYAAISDGVRGGVSLYRYFPNVGWDFEGQVVTNDVNAPLRVHGLNFNPSEFKFYTMISGQESGSTRTYSGSGVYSFTPDIPFLGYKHLDYSTGSNSFTLKDELTLGYVQYDISAGSLKRSPGLEPQGIDETMPVLKYDPNSPQFFNRRQIGFGGSEAYNHGIELKDGRTLFVGTKALVDVDFDISYNNGILSIFYPNDTSPPEHYEIVGRFDDFITGVCQSKINDKIYFTGFTKDLLVPRSQLFVHGIGRGLIEDMMTSNKIEYVDMAIDPQGSQYYVGNHLQNSNMILAKYDLNFELLWQKQIDGGSLNDTAYSIARDNSGYLYVAGKTTNSGSGNEDAVIIKLNNSGSVEWTKTYGTAQNQYASSIDIVTNIDTDFLVYSIVSGSNTTIVVSNTDGEILEQRSYDNFIVNKVRTQQITNNGRYVVAGRTNDNPTIAKFGLGALGSGLQWMRTYTSASANTVATDFKPITSTEYILVGNEGNNGFAMKLTSGSGTITKTWGRSISASVLNGVTYTTLEQSIVVGFTSASGNVLQGAVDAVIAGIDNTGNLTWANTFGHTGNDVFNVVETDVTDFNVIAAGWSESHTSGRRGTFFRASRVGFGTGNYHLEGAPGMALWYLSSSALVPLSNTGTINTALTTNTSGNLLTSQSTGFIATSTNYMNEIYEGGNNFDGFMGILDLNDLQDFKNTSAYKQGELNELNNLVQFYQIGVAGDGEADDGNVLGYDIIELTDGRIVIAAQTSGDITKINTGNTGVYDYLIGLYDTNAQSFVIKQNGSAFDEEIYALTEISGSKIAFVGRTSGDLGGTQVDPIGSYDLFLGIMDPDTLEASYYTTGSGNADRAFNVHDLYPITGQPEVIITYETAGNLGGTNQGPNDIGVIRFNYNTDQWYSGSLVGSSQSEFLETLGHVSTLTEDGRIAIVGSTTGVFADDGVTYGSSDIYLAIYDIYTHTWKKYQIGSGAADFGRSVETGANNKLIIGGSTAATFTEPNDVIVVEFDMARGLKGRITE